MLDHERHNKTSPCITWEEIEPLFTSAHRQFIVLQTKHD